MLQRKPGQPAWEYRYIPPDFFTWVPGFAACTAWPFNKEHQRHIRLHGYCMPATLSGLMIQWPTCPGGLPGSILYGRGSPLKKTWEGSIGGAAFAIILAIILSRFNTALTLPGWIGLAMVVVVFGTLGDLFESWLKRRSGKKDSGRLLPGHGGILDRFDSLLMASPFVSIYLILVL